MGRAALANPRSFAGGKDPEAVALARLIVVCRHVRTPREFDNILATVPAEARDDLRAILKPHVSYDPAAIKAEEDRIARALAVVAQSGGVD